MAQMPINEQRKTEASLASVEMMTPDQIRAIRPPLPMTPLFAPRYGYGEAEALSIGDCFSASRDNMARYDFSGSQGAYSGTSTPSLGTW